MGSSTQVYVYQRKSRVKVSIFIGDAKNCLGNSVLYYQAQEQRFWVDRKAWGQMPKASPSPILVSKAKIDVFSTKIAKFVNVSTL